MAKFRHDDKRPIRKALEAAFEKADLILETEKELIKTLKIIDANRFYVWMGYKSLMGFCDDCLKFSRTQSLRIVTLVRRSDIDVRNTLPSDIDVQNTLPSDVEVQSTLPSDIDVQNTTCPDVAVESALRADSKDAEEDYTNYFKTTPSFQPGKSTRSDHSKDRGKDRSLKAIGADQ